MGWYSVSLHSIFQNFVHEDYANPTQNLLYYQTEPQTEPLDLSIKRQTSQSTESSPPANVSLQQFFWLSGTEPCEPLVSEWSVTYVVSDCDKTLWWILLSTIIWVHGKDYLP